MPVISQQPSHTQTNASLAARMARPQRHRLLQGYPALPLMPERGDIAPERHWADDAASLARPLIVGIMPHTYCNPAVRGCGFCTFPHESFKRSLVEEAAAAVESEIARSVAHSPSLQKRHIHGVYFGGGTANLMSPTSFEALTKTLCQHYSLALAEVTLEGVPRYFLSRGQAQLDILQQLDCRQPRISLGVQTFDRQQIKRMGREAFGDKSVIEEVIAAAQQRGMTTSVDLLFNLPGQSLADMKRDIDCAHRLGFDQICIYHLVLFKGLGTRWSREQHLLDALPTNQQACDHWLALREHLLALGYQQTTLTNFERTSVAASPAAFQYERCSFHPEDYDAIGFGPGAISSRFDWPALSGIKWMNKPRSQTYGASIAANQHASALAFNYHAEDLKLLFLTRKLPTMAISKNRYQQLFDSSVMIDFEEFWLACLNQDLIEHDETHISLTPKGMFYADSIAGLLAHERSGKIRPGALGVRSARLRLLEDDAAYDHMG